MLCTNAYHVFLQNEALFFCFLSTIVCLLLCVCSPSHSVCFQINFNLILMILLEVLMASTVILSARSAEDCCCHRKVCVFLCVIAFIPANWCLSPLMPSYSPHSSIVTALFFLSIFQPMTYDRPMVITPAVFPTRLLKAYSVSSLDDISVWSILISQECLQ